MSIQHSSVSGSELARASRRAGATTFAACLLVVIGLLHVVQGLTVLLSDGFFDTPRGYFVSEDITTWGWMHLVLGAAGVAAGAGLLKRTGWSRGTAVVVATLSMLGSFIWLPFYPVGTWVVIALDIFVMWAAFADLRPGVR